MPRPITGSWGQSLYLDRLIAMSGALKTASGAGSFAEDAVSGLVSHRDLHEGCCFQAESRRSFSLTDKEDLYYQYKDMGMGDKRFLIERLVLAEIRQVKGAAEKNRRSANGTDRDHYDYLLKRIGLFLEGK